MSFKGICPRCNAPIDLEQAARDQAGRELLREITTLGPLASLVLEYVESFKPRPDAHLAPAKALRIVREVRAILTDGEITFDGRRTRVSHEQMDAALREMSARSLIALKNHNYLKQVLLGMARKVAAPPPREAAPRPAASRHAPPASEHDRISPEEAKAFVQQITQGIGKSMPEGEGE